MAAEFNHQDVELSPDEVREWERIVARMSTAGEESVLGLPRSSDTEFITALRAGIDRENNTRRIFNSRAVFAQLAGVCAVVLFLIVRFGGVPGTGKLPDLASRQEQVGFPQDEADLRLMSSAEDMVVSAPMATSKLSEGGNLLVGVTTLDEAIDQLASSRITADSVANFLEIPNFLDSLDLMTSDDIGTDELLTLDEDVLAAVMDEFEGTRFY